MATVSAFNLAEQREEAMMWVDKTPLSWQLGSVANRASGRRASQWRCRKNIVCFFEQALMEQFASVFYLHLSATTAWEAFCQSSRIVVRPPIASPRHVTALWKRFRTFYEKEQLARVEQRWPEQKHEALIKYGLKRVLHGYVDSDELFDRYADIFFLLNGMNGDEPRSILGDAEYVALQLLPAAGRRIVHILREAGECAAARNAWAEVARHFGNDRAADLLKGSASISSDANPTYCAASVLLDMTVRRFFGGRDFSCWKNVIDPDKTMRVRDLCLLPLGDVRERSTWAFKRVLEQAKVQLSKHGLHIGMTPQEVALWERTRNSV